MKTAVSQRLLDRCAIAASTVCAIHCLVTPLLIVLLPVLASTVLADDTFHRFMLLWVVPTSVLALWLGCRRHRDGGVLLLGLAGLAMLVVTGFWGDALFGEHGEKAVTVMGSLAVCAGHWRNYRLCRSEDHDDCAAAAKGSS